MKQHGYGWAPSSVSEGGFIFATANCDTCGRIGALFDTVDRMSKEDAEVWGTTLHHYRRMLPVIFYGAAGDDPVPNTTLCSICSDEMGKHSYSAVADI